MAEFRTPLDLRVLRSRTLFRRPSYQLLAPLRYYSDLLGFEIVAPASFVTDLASVPLAPVAWWLFGTAAAYGAVIHDLCYQHRGAVPGAQRYITKAEADAVFAEAMALHVTVPGTAVDDPPIPWAPRTAMFAAVRIGGRY